MVKIKEITKFLETLAPLSYQESYDNAGLITGDGATEVTGILCCLDAVETVIDEAIDQGCNLVVAHHPIVFKGLKRFNGRNYVERTLIKAIKHDIAIYAIHTNLDNMLYRGVNGKIAEKLGLEGTRILSPGKQLKKLTAFVPLDASDRLRAALLAAGAGSVNGFDQISHSALGVGSAAGQLAAQMRLEVVFHAALQGAMVAAIAKLSPMPYFEVHGLDNESLDIGAGLIGQLPSPMQWPDFLNLLKESFLTGAIRHTALPDRPVSTVALCGGAGSFLLPAAIAQKADAFVTSDFKYHEFFDADGHLLIADIGHFESEQFTIDLLHDIISEKFPTFAPLKTGVNTNPVFYFS